MLINPVLSITSVKYNRITLHLATQVLLHVLDHSRKSYKMTYIPAMTNFFMEQWQPSFKSFTKIQGAWIWCQGACRCHSLYQDDIFEFGSIIDNGKYILHNQQTFRVFLIKMQVNKKVDALTKVICSYGSPFFWYFPHSFIDVILYEDLSSSFVNN